MSSTCPNSEPMDSPMEGRAINVESDHQTVPTPCTSSSGENSHDTTGSGEHPSKNIQAAAYSNAFSDIDSEGDGEMEEERDHEQGFSVQKVNCRGKVKIFKCKHCDFETNAKTSLWKHAETHIDAEKRRRCPECSFVTKFKHHLDYHMRNHLGSKPFKCDKCSYSCVNKSMLNSHLKSHSNVYQYRCADCSYATKYCHSLKLHLRKYTHAPAMVLNPDGTPNPSSRIDVYGTKRGPKMTSVTRSSEESSPESVPTLPLPFYQHLSQIRRSLDRQQICNSLMLQNCRNLAINNPEHVQLQESVAEPMEPETLDVGEPQTAALDLSQSETGALDLSKPETPFQETGACSQGQETCPADESTSDEDDYITTVFDNVEVILDDESEADEWQQQQSAGSGSGGAEYNCRFCRIQFTDQILHMLHMSFHNNNDPFKCNRCGKKCSDNVSFFVHIGRDSHY